eukprot:snap_masked-scaffold1197_size55989-processed-gene-0.4 protein:Tk09662 transcript:snap_masked-scaffold1197_size55989-processed-gene-0.4-mRNA-1 annotation:"sodium channel auxiliary subunit -like protein"
MAAVNLQYPGLLLDPLGVNVSPPPATTWKIVTEWLLFYLTAFFVLLAIFSIFALIFLVPFFIDPAWSTLQADFEPRGLKCRTISGVYKEGRSNCEWSSCEEGCTKTIYTCWQIEVEYENLLAFNRSDSHEPEKFPIQDDVPVKVGKLFPNIKGCGYPPSISCPDFVDKYKTNGTTFTCFVSKKMPEIVLAELDLDQVRDELFYSLAIPIPCLLASVVYLVVAYFYIYDDSPPDKSHTYRPIAMLSSAAAMTAFIDVSSKDMSEHERQRKRLLLQAQRAKLMAHGKSPSAPGLMIRSTVLSAATSSVSLNEALHLGTNGGEVAALKPEDIR